MGTVPKFTKGLKKQKKIVCNSENISKLQGLRLRKLLRTKTSLNYIKVVETQKKLDPP